MVVAHDIHKFLPRHVLLVHVLNGFPGVLQQVFHLAVLFLLLLQPSLFVIQRRRREECPVGQLGHLTVLTLKEEVFVTIVCHAVKVHHTLNHELGKEQFRLASDIQPACDEILSAVVEAETLYLARLVGLALASAVSPEVALL